MASPRSVFVVVAAPVLFALACGSDSDERAQPTTSLSVSTTTAPASTTPTSDPTIPDGDTTTTTAESAPPSISVAVYWTRPFGQARPIDIPGYRDGVTDSYPYVLYGSATNTGDESIAQPQVSVEWSADGETVHTAVAAVRDPEGGVATELASGASADVVVVVDDETVASRLADAVPSFEVYG